MDQYVISKEELDVLRSAIRNAMAQLQFVGDRLGTSVVDELRKDIPVRESTTRPVLNIKGLRRQIKAILDQSGRPMRSVDITDAIFHPALGITKDRLSRRVIVAISAMYKSGDQGIYKIENGKEALWTSRPPTSQQADSNDTEVAILPSRVGRDIAL